MLLRKDGDKWLGEERLYLEAGGLAGIAEETCVKLTLLKFLYNNGGVGLAQLQVHLWEEPAIAAKHGGQRCEHCRSDEPHSQEALFAATDAARLVDVFLHVAKRSSCAFQKDFSGAGKFHGTRCPKEEGIAKDVFEFADLL